MAPRRWSKGWRQATAFKRHNDADPPADRWPSELTRSLLSAFFIVTIVGLAVGPLPESELRRQVLRVNQPFLDATGLGQRWNVFAPSPRRQVVVFRAQVRFDDGSTGVYRPPAGGPLIAAYWDYHWRKWVETLVDDSSRDAMWQPTAEWIARSEGRGRKRVAEVTLIRRWYDEGPPGPGPARGPWQQFVFFRWPTSGAGTGGGGGGP